MAVLMAVTDEPPPRHTLNRTIPKGSSVVLRCLAKKPDSGSRTIGSWPLPRAVRVRCGVPAPSTSNLSRRDRPRDRFATVILVDTALPALDLPIGARASRVE